MNYPNGFSPAGYGHPPPQGFAQNGGTNTQSFAPPPMPQGGHLQQHQQPQQQMSQQQQVMMSQMAQGQQPQGQQLHHQQPYQPPYAGMGMNYDMSNAAAMGMQAGNPSVMPVGTPQSMGGPPMQYQNSAFGQIQPAPSPSHSVPPQSRQQRPPSQHQQHTYPQQQQQPQQTQSQPQPSTGQQQQQQHNMQQQTPTPQPLSAQQTSMSPQRQFSPQNNQGFQQPRTPASAPGQNQTPQSHQQRQGSLQNPQFAQPSIQANSTGQPQTTPFIPPQAPLSPAAREREKDRVSLILLINGELLQEVMKLQTGGNARTSSDAGQVDGSSQENESGDGSNSKPKKPPTAPEYFECMRRLQVNLAYLAAIADRAHKPTAQIPTCPSIIYAPERLPTLHKLYDHLKSLFPDAPPSALNASKGTPAPAPAQKPSSSQSPAQKSWHNTPLKAGASNPPNNANMPATTQAEQRYKRWLEDMRSKAPTSSELPDGV